MLGNKISSTELEHCLICYDTAVYENPYLELVRCSGSLTRLHNAQVPTPDCRPSGAYCSAAEQLSLAPRINALVTILKFHHRLESSLLCSLDNNMR